MMRYQIGRYVIGLAYFCSMLFSDAALATASKPSEDGALPPCPVVNKQSRERLGTCSKPEPHRRPSPYQPRSHDTADNDPPPADDHKQASEATKANGHFDAKGRTGLIPVGRVGWREIGSWREIHRVRDNRQVP